MRPVELLPYLIPFIVLGILFLRMRPGRARPVRIASLWIAPLVATLGIGSALWFQPHPAFHVGAYAIFAVGLALGIGTGVLRAHTLTLRRCPDTDKVLMETSSFAFILLAALVLLRMAFRNMSGSLGVVAVDASMLFALGMIVTQRLTIWMRVRTLPPLAA
jgi:membrane protein CcdC involved in cytochrome C biogenesis